MHGRFAMWHPHGAVCAPYSTQKNKGFRWGRCWGLLDGESGSILAAPERLRGPLRQRSPEPRSLDSDRHLSAAQTSAIGNRERNSILRRLEQIAIIDFGGVKEEVVTRDEFPVQKALEVLKNETIAVIGYGVQGPAQALNMRDNGFNVIVGQSQKFKRDWDRAVNDGWVPGKTLFDIEEAAKKGTVVQMLVSDAAQKAIWPLIKTCLNPGDALYFSHGFSIVYRDQTGVVPPANVDVILVAPKGSGTSVRRNFLSGAGINSSFAVEQDFTKRAKDRCMALGIAVGSGYLFPTTFKNEVFSDLTGERGVLMGALAGIMEAQYEVLRTNGHTPSEAFNETVEELTQSLIRL